MTTEQVAAPSIIHGVTQQEGARAVLGVMGVLRIREVRDIENLEIGRLPRNSFLVLLG